MAKMDRLINKLERSMKRGEWKLKLADRIEKISITDVIMLPARMLIAAFMFGVIMALMPLIILVALGTVIAWAINPKLFPEKEKD